MDNWERINSLFDRAADLPAGQRGPFLDAETGGDVAVRAQVERLLQEVEGASDRISAIVNSAREVGQTEEIQGIGPYRMLREIGRGGMGSVWLAERADGEFQQKVAIKRVKVGLASEELDRRFRRERQILSRLDHPHIARLLDGGATPDNLPYLVMEYVDGVSILDYVRANQCSPDRVVHLFRTVCSAVQYAHTNLIVHRDLKPSNILVTGDGNVKLLDFGIAKLVEVDATDEALTHTGWQPFTPAYASPEQKRGDTHSTVSDIYSLGKILAELIAAPDRDIAAIIDKATREEPAARYASATQLLDDLARYAAGEPVLARQGNLRYQAIKFLRRNRLLAAAVSVVLALILGFSFWTAVQNQRIQRERDRAESVASFLAGLFAAADPERNQGNRVSTREMLDLGAVRIRDSVSDPVTQSRLMETIGEAYFHLGIYDRAIPMLEDVLGRYQKQDRAPVQSHSRVMGWLAEAETARGRRDVGDRWGIQAVGTARGIRPYSSDTVARALYSRCSQLHGATRFADAAKACAESVSQAAASTLNPMERAPLYVMLGTALKDSNDFKGAEAALQHALSLSGGSGANSNSVHAQARAELASVYFREGRMAEAEEGFREAVVFKRKLYPDGHLDLARTLNNHANVLATLKSFPQAIRIYGEAHAMYRRFLGAESSELASSLSNLAVLLASTGELQQATDTLREVIAMQARTIGAGKLPHLSSQIKLAAILVESRQFAESAALLEDTLLGIQRLNPVPEMDQAYARTLLAISWLESGQPARALALSNEAGATLGRILKETHWMRQLADTARAGSLLRTGKQAEAAAILGPLVAAYDKNKATGWRSTLAHRLAREAGRAAM